MHHTQLDARELFLTYRLDEILCKLLGLNEALHVGMPVRNRHREIN